MEVDLLSTTWTSNQTIAWKETVDPIVYGIDVGLSFIALVIFYIFPRLRIFPRSILSWVNIYNLLYNISLVIKWLPQSVLHESWVIHLEPGSAICKAGILLDNIGIIGPTCCTFLLCLTMFLCTVLRKDIEGHRVYFWSYLAFAVAFPFAVSAIPALVFAKQQTQAFAICVIANPISLPVRLITITVFVVQTALFAITMFYITKAFARVRNTTTTNAFPMTYLVARFSAMFLCQILALIPLQVAFLVEDPSVRNNAIFNRFTVIASFIGKALEAFVLIFGNIDFMEWVKKKYNAIFRKELPISPQTNHKENAQQMVEEGLPNELEMVKLSTSGHKMGTSTPTRLSFVVKTSLHEESSDIADGLS